MLNVKHVERRNRRLSGGNDRVVGMSLCAECGSEVPPTAGSCTDCGAPWPPEPGESPESEATETLESEVTWRLLPASSKPPPPAVTRTPPPAASPPPSPAAGESSPDMIIGGLLSLARESNSPPDREIPPAVNQTLPATSGPLPPPAGGPPPPAEGGPLPPPASGPWPPPADGPWPAPESGPRPRRRGIVIVVAVAAALGGLAAWLLISQPAAHERPAAQSPAGAGQPAATGPASSSAPPSSPAAPSPRASTPHAKPRHHGAVALGPGARRQPGAHHVAAFLATYFAAINNHDYHAYISLFDPLGLPIQSRQEFLTGFRSTKDSGARLVSISPTAAGPAAEITFDSHQRPVDSATQSACTSWRITLFLETHGRTYLIGKAPATYRSEATRCG
jgi:hypothetical protein